MKKKQRNVQDLHSMGSVTLALSVLYVLVFFHITGGECPMYIYSEIVIYWKYMYFVVHNILLISSGTDKEGIWFAYFSIKAYVVGTH